MLGDWVEEAAIEGGIEGHAQLAVILITEGDEAEGLQAGALKLARRVQHFGHAVDGSRPGVERDLDEISSRKLVLQLQQAAVDRERLKFGTRPLTAFGHHGGRNRSI